MLLTLLNRSIIKKKRLIFLNKTVIREPILKEGII